LFYLAYWQVGFDRQEAMKIFVYEFTCSASSERYPAVTALRPEGRAMLSAIAHDFARLQDVEVLCLTSASEPIVLADPVQTYFHNGDERSEFLRLAREADWTLAIAPESEDILLDRCRWVGQGGGKWLGSTPQAIALASDKLELNSRLRELDVPTPPATIVESRQASKSEALTSPLVLKPRSGAGCLHTYLANDRSELETQLTRLAEIQDAGEMIMQPYVSGQAASVTFVTGRKGLIALLPAMQDIRTAGQFSYCGGTIPLREVLSRRAVALSKRAVCAIPGLRGFVGVDIVLGAAEDGGQDYVIEVNARLTTSYIGLRALATTNLAGAVLRTTTDDVLPDVGWRGGNVRFWPDGRVEVS
jgi:predicted ATP-grasp superfamily ATP-dependent carboligase